MQEFGPTDSVVFKCDDCGTTPVLMVSAQKSQWPYDHLDVFTKCPMCGGRGVHGVGFHGDGFFTYVFDSKPNELWRMVENFIRTENPDMSCCGEMTLTKVFGDQGGYKDGNCRLQWKCHKCYRVRHLNVKLPKVPGQATPKASDFDPHQDYFKPHI